MAQARYHGNVGCGAFFNVFNRLLEDALLCLDEYIQCDASLLLSLYTIILVFFVGECDFQLEHRCNGGKLLLFKQ